MKKRALGYWITTGLFCVVMAFGGTSHLIRTEGMVEGMTHLGYPLYVMGIIGTGKVLGALALAVPGKPLLKEWAYAGFAFDLIGATVSHAVMGDPIAETAPPVFVFLLGAASYQLRPADRRLVLSR